MEYIHLQGAEEVSNASRSIAASAEVMMRAANTVAEELMNQRQFLDDWLMRLEEVFKAKGGETERIEKRTEDSQDYTL